MNSKIISVITSIYVIQIFSGCIPFTYYVTPEVLPKNVTSNTMYVSYFPSEEKDEVFTTIDNSYRRGLGHNMDFGAGFSINTFGLSSIILDAKYQFMQAPIKAAFDIGVSYSGSLPYLFKEFGGLGVHPSLAIGLKSVNIAYTRNIIKLLYDPEKEIHNYSIINGSYVLGKTIQLSPQITILIRPEEKPMYLYGFGLSVYGNRK